MGLGQSCSRRQATVACEQAAATNEADGPWITIGDLVLLKHLLQTELNGQRARVIPPTDGVPVGQVGVQLESCGRQLAVELNNLEFLGATSKTASRTSSARESSVDGTTRNPAAKPSSLEEAEPLEAKMEHEQSMVMTSATETMGDCSTFTVGAAVLLRDLLQTELNGQQARVILATDPLSADRVGVQLVSSGKRVTVKARNLESSAAISEKNSSSLSRKSSSMPLTREALVDCTASSDGAATPSLDDACSDGSSSISLFGPMARGPSAANCNSVCTLETVSQAKRRRKEAQWVKRLAAIESSILDIADHQMKANNRLQSLEDVAKRIQGDPLSELYNSSVASIADQLTEVQISMDVRMHRIECLLFASDYAHFHKIDQVLRGITNTPEQQEETRPIAQPDPEVSPSQSSCLFCEHPFGDAVRNGDDEASLLPPRDFHMPSVTLSAKKLEVADTKSANNYVVHELPSFADSSEALHALQYGIDMFKMEQADAAIVSFTAGLELLSKANGKCDEHLRAVFHSNRAFVHSKTEKWADALEDLNVVLGIEEKNAEARYRRALIKFELGMVQDSLSDIEIVLVESDNPLARKLHRQLLGR